MTDLHGRPTAAELVAAVADFLDHEVRDAVTGSVNFHARVAANALRMVERELEAPQPVEVTAALNRLGVPDEAALAQAIRAGAMDHRGEELTSVLRAIVSHRLAAAHPGYEHE
ncbi:MAG: DUF6285 domain-containing protein [Mycobacterium sp.]